jgi:hypothetical protein
VSDNLARSFLDRVRFGLSQVKDLSRMSEWMCKNTRHPKDPSKMWSFHEHEFQKAIVNDSANDMAVKKCAQVGLSELSVRLALGLIDVLPNSTAIYTLPTGGFASTFVKSRFDPVISNSPELSSRMDRDTDNTSLKKLGGSFLYVRGTFTQTAAISVPADILVHDEVDFSDQKTLTSFTSRLGHVKEEDIIRRRFSTPTVAGYGVSELFDNSTQNWYGVKCRHCETWQVPKFQFDVVIPGYDGKIIELEKEDLTDQRYRIDEAWLKCPGCGGELDMENLADPSRRQWIAAKPGRDRSGYQVQPFDLPSINPVSRTIRSLDDFDLKSDWVNFKMGQDYQDAETSFVPEAVKKAFCLPWVQPRPGAATGTYIGVDVGKTSWISILKMNELSGSDVIHYERVKVRSEHTLPDRVNELFNWYGSDMAVIDAGPEWTQALSVISKLPKGKAFACYYKGRAKPNMSFIEVDEENSVVLAYRTALITDAAKKVNEGKVRFARAPDRATYVQHLDAMKRVRRYDSKGQEDDVWVNNGPDHYAHTLFFASVARLLLNYRPKVVVVPALPLPVKARIRSLENQSSTYHDRH